MVELWNVKQGSIGYNLSDWPQQLNKLKHDVLSSK